MLAMPMVPELVSSSVRHTVGGEATGPSAPAWWRSTSISAIASPPPASITATSVNTLLRSCTGVNPQRSIVLDNSAVSPDRSARNRVTTLPAWATAPTSAETHKPANHEASFTYQVPSSETLLNSPKSKNPSQDRHFRASHADHTTGAVKDPG